MNDAPVSNDQGPDGLPPDLRWLKRLVTLLTGTMVAGLVVVIWLLVIRLPASIATPLPLPASITLPDGTQPQAFTQGRGWYAVVTDGNAILIYDAKTGTLRQTVQIAE